MFSEKRPRHKTQMGLYISRGEAKSQLQSPGRNNSMLPSVSLETMRNIGHFENLPRGADLGEPNFRRKMRDLSKEPSEISVPSNLNRNLFPIRKQSDGLNWASYDPESSYVRTSYMCSRPRSLDLNTPTISAPLSSHTPCVEDPIRRASASNLRGFSRDFDRQTSLRPSPANYLKPLCPIPARYQRSSLQHRYPKRQSVLTSRLSKVVDKIWLGVQIEKLNAANESPKPTSKIELKKIKNLLQLNRQTPKLGKDYTPKNLDAFLEPPELDLQPAENMAVNLRPSPKPISLLKKNVAR